VQWSFSVGVLQIEVDAVDGSEELEQFYVIDLHSKVQQRILLVLAIAKADDVSTVLLHFLESVEVAINGSLFGRVDRPLHFL